jgi:23S rRNA pseudouridine1911/1915/1917 synthase
MQFEKAVKILHRRVLERLPHFKDTQLMSVGSSLAGMGFMDESTFRAIREEAVKRGRHLDNKHTTNLSSFSTCLHQLPLAYEDEHTVVLNKPPGYVVSLTSDLDNKRDRKNQDVVKGSSPELQDIIAQSSLFPISKDPGYAHGILHRLDRDTSGALIVAKSFESFYDLRSQFACNQVSKEYVALVHGSLGEIGETIDIDSRIATTKLKANEKLHISSSVTDNNEGKYASTQVQPLAQFRDIHGNELTLIRAQIHTGRTHQIRVHLSSLGHALVNDIKYGSTMKLGRILLHASKVGFMKIGRDLTRVEVRADLPSDLEVAITGLQLEGGSIQF